MKSRLRALVRLAISQGVTGWHGWRGAHWRMTADKLGSNTLSGPWEIALSAHPTVTAVPLALCGLAALRRSRDLVTQPPKANRASGPN